MNMRTHMLLAGICLVAIGILIVLKLCSSSIFPPGDAAPGVQNAPEFGLFRDVTKDSGIQHTYRNGEDADFCTMLETLGGGVGIIDYDNDGLFDVFLTGGGFFEGGRDALVKGHPCRLFKNLGGMRFRDVTTEVGL